METLMPLEHHLDILAKSTPKMRYDGSIPLDEWKKQARAKLSELLGMDKFTKVDDDIEIESVEEVTDDKGLDYTETTFTFASEENYRPYCKLLVPKGKSKPPIVIAITGHNKGIHNLMGRSFYEEDEGEKTRYSTQRARHALTEGYAALMIEQRGFGQRGGSKDGPGCLQIAVTAMLLGRTIIGERVWDISRLIDVVEKHFAGKVDVTRIALSGGSGGGTATYYTTCLEDRITVASPSVAVCEYSESIAPVRHCMCNYIPRIAEYFEMGDLGGLISPRVMVMDNGLKDPSFRVKGSRESAAKIKRFYELDGAPDNFVYIEGQEGHQFYYDQVWPEFNRLSGWKEQ